MAMTTQPRILVIAPETNLDTVPEVDALYALGYNVQLVPNPPTRDRLFAMTRQRRFEIIHFAGHASRDGILLGHRPDGNGDEFIDAPGLVQLARSAHCELLFLNGCETAEIGQVLVDEHIPAVICTLRTIDDQMAKETAQLFYQRYQETHDIRTAYNTSKPPVKGGYSLFRNGSVTSELLAPVLEQIAQLTILMQESAAERTTIVAANNAEHDEFRAALRDLMQCSDSFKSLRRWGVQVFAVAIMVVVIINVVFNLLR